MESKRSTPQGKGKVIGQTKDGILVRHPKRKEIYQLQPIIYRIWEACDGKTEEEKIVMNFYQRTAEIFGEKVERSKVERIINMALEELTRKNLIE